MDDSRTASDGLRPRRKVNAAEKRALRRADLSLFIIQYARKRQKRVEPNDRRYDREIEQAIKRMKPETLDQILRDDED